MQRGEMWLRTVVALLGGWSTAWSLYQLITSGLEADRAGGVADGIRFWAGIGLVSVLAMGAALRPKGLPSPPWKDLDDG